MTTLTLAYKSTKNDSNNSTFSCGIAAEMDGDRNFVVGFPTLLPTYQRASLAALKYAVNILRPLPKDFVIKSNIKYLADLFDKTETGEYKTNPKAYASEINDIRSKAPNLRIEKADDSIIDICNDVAETAAVENKLCWFGYAPCLALNP